MKFMSPLYVFIGAVKGPSTGQKAAFLEACLSINNRIIVNSFFESILDIACYFYVLLTLFLKKPAVIYFTGSRTTKGFLIRDLPLLIFSKVFSTSLICHIHGNDFELFRLRSSFLMRALIDLFYNNVHSVLVPATGLISHFSFYNLRSVHVIRNPISDIFCELITPSSSLKSELIRFIYLSNFIESKGFKIVVEAVRSLRQMNYPVELLLCGRIIESGEVQAQHRSYLNSLDGLGFIRVVENIDESNKVYFYKDSRYFVLPTSYATESSPISILEALASGCYVITSPQGQIPEMLGGFYASIISPTESAIVDEVIKIEAFGGPEPSRLVENRNKVLSLYSSRSFRESIKNVIESAS